MRVNDINTRRRFGASARGPVVTAKLGFTADAVHKVAHEVIAAAREGGHVAMTATIARFAESFASVEEYLAAGGGDAASRPSRLPSDLPGPAAARTTHGGELRDVHDR
jgi:hypothetical protein